jgi:hypothetical protein
MFGTIKGDPTLRTFTLLVLPFPWNRLEVHDTSPRSVRKQLTQQNDVLFQSSVELLGISVQLGFLFRRPDLQSGVFIDSQFAFRVSVSIPLLLEILSE